jgi:hypothetical protein
MEGIPQEQEVDLGESALGHLSASLFSGVPSQAALLK